MFAFKTSHPRPLPSGAGVSFDPPGLYGIGLVAALALIPVLGVFMPRFMAFMPGVMALFAVAAWPFVFRDARLSFSRKLMIPAAMIFGFAALSILWSIDPGSAAERVGKLGLVLLSGVLLLGVLSAVPVRILQPAMWLVPLLLGAGVLFINVELLLGLPVYRFIHGVAEGKFTHTAWLNRSVVIAVLFFIPAFVIAYRRAWLFALLLLVLFLPLLLQTSSQSAVLAFLTGLLFLKFFPAQHAWAWCLLGALVCGSLIAAPWIARAVFPETADIMAALPYIGSSAYPGQRLEIWDFVARYALQNPLYGYGIEATRFITDFDTARIYHKDATVLHPHNAALQIWIEFGAAGIAGVCALVVLFLNHIRTTRAPSSARMIVAVFMAVLSVSAVGYGLWQGWWLGLLLLTAALCKLAEKTSEE